MYIHSGHKKAKSSNLCVLYTIIAMFIVAILFAVGVWLAHTGQRHVILVTTSTIQAVLY